jgi:hypothetical protein
MRQQQLGHRDASIDRSRVVEESPAVARLERFVGPHPGQSPRDRTRAGIRHYPAPLATGIGGNPWATRPCPKNDQIIQGCAASGLERPFAHLDRTGRMRRVHLRGHDNILKRALLQAGALNLGLLMRQLVGIGTPGSLQGRAASLLACLWSLIHRPEHLWNPIRTLWRLVTALGHLRARLDERRTEHWGATTSATCR